MQTTSFFGQKAETLSGQPIKNPDQWRVHDGNCEWIIDTGYPDSQICKNISVIDGFKIPGSTNNPICEELDASTCGILGSSFLKKHSVSGDKHTTVIDGDAGTCEEIQTQTHSTTEQTSATFRFEYDGKVIDEECFIDTGGGVSMMSETLADAIGFPRDMFGQAEIQHTDHVGNVVTSPISVGRNPGVTVSSNRVDLTPSRFAITSDKLNTLYDYHCSVGEKYFENVQRISIDLPRNRLCVNSWSRKVDAGGGSSD